MRRATLAAAILVLSLVLAGCGDSDGGPVLVVQDILSSDGTLDGDITNNLGVFSVFTSDIGPNTVLFGQDPAVPGVESRGFITFPLDSIPPGAVIQSATILLPILRVELFATVPPPTSVAGLVDLVSFAPLDTLVTQGQMASVFDTTPLLLGPSFEVFPGEAGFDEVIDATDALLEARRLGFFRLQIRLIGSFGVVEIDDLDPALGGLTPLLHVEYLS